MPRLGFSLPAPSEASRRCTTERETAHRTVTRRVLYPWHPWSGRAVRVRDVVEKATRLGHDALSTGLLRASGCDGARVVHKPRLLSDNGSSYIAGDLAVWLEDQGIDHVRGAPNHPQTQGKIERWHQTLKNRILLENYYLPGDLETQIGTFVDHYNRRRYHESLANLTPADVYFRRGQAIIDRRESMKRRTIEQRRLAHRHHAA